MSQILGRKLKFCLGKSGKLNFVTWEILFHIVSILLRRCDHIVSILLSCTAGFLVQLFLLIR